ncbi:uncharacterized protein LOC126878495 [Diabrotica virgifera virgifera]|uniref:Uncharacterized protein n=1 Tax=Diabrotica virgifera virgifera TaxID=50390 RepID=A0ABM5JGY3_DIAVI|nr:uncharacterized protein LOC126878495 [Diabrotica virgifera virgifera]
MCNKILFIIVFGLALSDVILPTEADGNNMSDPAGLKKSCSTERAAKPEKVGTWRWNMSGTWKTILIIGGGVLILFIFTAGYQTCVLLHVIFCDKEVKTVKEKKYRRLEEEV